MESNHAIILGVCFIFVLLGLIGGLAGLDSGSGGNITQNITYNNTTIGGGNGSGTTDHYNLTNLTFESSGHTSDTTKVNRSGDTITGDLNFNSAGSVNLNYTPSTTGVLYINAQVGSSAIRMQTTGVSRASRFGAFGGSGAVSNYQFFLNSTTNFSNLDGLAFLGIMNDQQKTNNGVAKLVLGYENITNNQGYISANPRTGAGDTAQNTAAWRSFGSNLSTQFYGNISSSNLAGSGNDWACLDADGKFYRDPTGCS